MGRPPYINLPNIQGIQVVFLLPYMKKRVMTGDQLLYRSRSSRLRCLLGLRLRLWSGLSRSLLRSLLRLRLRYLFVSLPLLSSCPRDERCRSSPLWRGGSSFLLTSEVSKMRSCSLPLRGALVSSRYCPRRCNCDDPPNPRELACFCRFSLVFVRQLSDNLET